MKKILIIFLVTVISFNNCNVAFSNVYSNIDYLNAPQKKDYIRHITQKGESISSILKQYQMDLKYFLEYNPEIEKRGRVNLNEILKIPRQGISTATDANIDRKIKKFVKAFEKKDNKLPSINQEKVVSNLPSSTANKFYYHNVMPKETLYSISKKYNVTIDDIHAANPFITKEGLRHNAAIRIPNNNYVEQSTQTGTVWNQSNNNISEVEVADFQIYADNDNPENISVAIIMPITGEDDLLDEGFKDLYRGFLLAADSLKRVGLSSKIDFYAIGRGTEESLELISSGQLENKDLIIGPVFEEQFNLVAQYAATRRIPIINPLLRADIDNGYVIEIQPTENTYWDKLEGITTDKKVFHYQSVNDDTEFIDGFIENISPFDSLMIYDKYTSPDTMALALDPSRGNVFVVASKDNLNNELLISKLVALKLTAYNHDITIVASRNVARISKDRRSDFFKADLRYVASSFQDRTDSTSMKFETEYIDTFALPPTAYSYRGYEIGVMLLEAYYDYGKDMMNGIADDDVRVLQVPYKFYREYESSKLINQQWILINYKPNYSIIIE